MIIDPQAFKLRARAGDQDDGEVPAPVAPGGGGEPGAPGR